MEAIPLIYIKINGIERDKKKRKKKDNNNNIFIKFQL